MDQVNLVVLIIYFTGLFLVLYRMFQSIIGLVTIKVNQESLQAQLTAQQLTDHIAIKFDFAEKYKFEPLEEISISITNKFTDKSLYINWDQCSLTDLAKKGRRIIRFNSKILVDLFLSQAFSVVAPDQTLKAKITTEDVLKRDDKGNLEIVSPLFDLKTLQQASQKEQPKKDPLQNSFFLQLVFQIIEPGVNPRNVPISILRFEFFVEQMRWQDAIIWKPKKDKK